MEAAELLKRIIEYGADREGINDRFNGNVELYATCFYEFLDEPNFAMLREALDAKDYARAFDAAHALKGLSGNLGVTAFYDADCLLVESLRAQQTASVESEYAAVQSELNKLKALLGDAPTAEPSTPPRGERRSRLRGGELSPDKRRDRFILLAIAALFVFTICVGYLFVNILNDYQAKMTMESAEHLVEITNQVKLYVEEKLANDWKTAGSIGDSIRYSNYQDDDEAIFNLMLTQRERWEVTDIQLFTESGYASCADGSVETNDIASDIAARAISDGRYMTVIDSKLIYTLPLQTSLRYDGQPIVAISVVQSMESFMDNMDFTLFDGNAWMYLTEESGVVLSKLNHKNASPVFSFKAILRQSDITVLDGDTSADGLLTAPMPTVFIMSNADRRDYAVSVPIATSTTPLRLFFLAPVEEVNKTMNRFSQRLSVVSMIVILSIVALAFAAFTFAYLSRKRQFNKAMLDREHMFDLLIKNTKTAFGLLTAGRSEPDYISANFDKVVGEPYYTLEKTDGGYAVRGPSGAASESLHELNEQLLAWDGKGEFRSAFIQKDKAAPSSWFLFQLYPADGEEQSFVAVAQDITKAHERENAVKDALSIAEKANEAKSRFLSDMSHDIRTPMNAIVNMTGFAIESINEPKKLGQYLQTIRESSDHLLCLVNDVLDMSRIESGQVVIESAPFNLIAEMQRQADIVKPLSDAKGQMLITDFSGVMDANVLGDRLKFTQIIMNLLSNAVKFTPSKGAVRFTAMEIPSPRADAVSLRCVVEDNGIGISAENLKHIFEPFNRANDKQVSRIEGTGLGLSICRSYVNAMGGVIRCESEEGEGSTFLVELYFDRADAASVEAEPSESAEATPFLGKHCLLAEDNATNQMIARTLLARLGFLIDMAGDGGECLQKFLQSPVGTYDVIYMDIRMPVMDGYQTAIAIRESRHPQAATIPIVAMTANAFAEDVEKARLAGMDGHLGKPILSSKIIEETYLAMHRRKEGTP